MSAPSAPKDWRTEHAKQLRKRLRGPKHRLARRLLTGLLKASDAVNYGCNQCLSAALYIDVALRPPRKRRFP